MSGRFREPVNILAICLLTRWCRQASRKRQPRTTRFARLAYLGTFEAKDGFGPTASLKYRASWRRRALRRTGQRAGRST
jgi:hypothetical protein